MTFNDANHKFLTTMNYFYQYSETCVRAVGYVIDKAVRAVHYQFYHSEGESDQCRHVKCSQRRYSNMSLLRHDILESIQMFAFKKKPVSELKHICLQKPSAESWQYKLLPSVNSFMKEKMSRTWTKLQLFCNATDKIRLNKRTIASWSLRQLNSATSTGRLRVHRDTEITVRLSPLRRTVLILPPSASKSSKQIRAVVKRFESSWLFVTRHLCRGCLNPFHVECDALPDYLCVWDLLESSY